MSDPHRKQPHDDEPHDGAPYDGAPYRVMTVCTGNICRSPMAEVVLVDRFARAGLADVVVVDSTGISDEEHGNPIDRRAARVLAAHGYPVPAHRARRARREDLAARDLVLAMTASHARALRAMVPDAASRVRMYRSFDPAAPAPAPAAAPAAAGPAAPAAGPEHRLEHRLEHDLDVDDPWYGDEAGFELTLAEIEAAADGVVAHVRAELAAREG
jgi:protein-tyrosine phosphatase